MPTFDSSPAVDRHPNQLGAVTLDTVALATTTAPAPNDTTPATAAAMTIVANCFGMRNALPRLALIVHENPKMPREAMNRVV